jgi:hypothetical protein
VTDGLPHRFDRRAFLARGAAVAAVVAGGAVVGPALVAGCAAPSGSGMAELFGERIGAVRAIGQVLLDDPAVAPYDVQAVVDGLPSEGLDAVVKGERLGLTFTDQVAFVAAVRQQSAADLGAGELVWSAGYPLTPTEASLAMACALSTV